MALTAGTGPLASHCAGAFNFDIDGCMPGYVLYLEDSPTRVRGYVGDTVVVDSQRVKMLHETDHLPVWYFPADDVRQELLEPTEHTTHCPRKGDAAYWSARVGGRTLDNVAWTYPQPLPGAERLAGLVAFYVDRLDRWLEEDDEIIGHPRDPYHRVDTRHASEHVVVRIGDEVVAESDRPVKLFETGLPVRYYLPVEDVRRDALQPSETRTVCPYKGIASYHSVRAGGRTVEDAAWFYPDPLGEALEVRDMVSFLGAGVRIELDGAPVDGG